PWAGKAERLRAQRESARCREGVGGGSSFFFSSRRRHTRSYGDWSSDVCSSDLGRTFRQLRGSAERETIGETSRVPSRLRGRPQTLFPLQRTFLCRERTSVLAHRHHRDQKKWQGKREIGRASCRERE